MSAHVDLMRSRKLDVPEPSSAVALEAGQLTHFVEVEKAVTTVRVNMSLPSDVVEIADRLARSRHMKRSHLVAQAIRKLAWDESEGKRR